MLMKSIQSGLSTLLCAVFVILMCLSNSWQATAPFLQFGAVGALTLLSTVVFQSYFATNKGW